MTKIKFFEAETSEKLEEKIQKWLEKNPNIRIITVSQSEKSRTDQYEETSIRIFIFYKERNH